MRGYVVYSTASIVIACACLAARAQQAAPPCGGEEIARGTVSRIADARTFALEDGREVRMAGIEVPPMPPPGEARTAALAAAAKTTLDALLGGDDVVLRRAEPAHDRYGRLFGYAYALRDGEEIFAQGELLAAGFARVAERAGGRACATELLTREQAARSGRLGLWADPYYDVVNAETPVDVLARRGRFALVEGKVVSVRESGSTIYVNFGRRWSEDFAVTIQKRNERSFAAAGLDLKALAGRRIRVRGWIEERGGASGTGGSPWIEAAYPEQIEIAETR
jgi:endonuclease YncB( thermonuclease family)